MVEPIEEQQRSAFNRIFNWPLGVCLVVPVDAAAAAVGRERSLTLF